MLLTAEETKIFFDCPRVRIRIKKFYIHMQSDNFLSFENMH
jgi:hypothetical protein